VPECLPHRGFGATTGGWPLPNHPLIVQRLKHSIIADDSAKKSTQRLMLNLYFSGDNPYIMSLFFWYRVSWWERGFFCPLFVFSVLIVILSRFSISSDVVNLSVSIPARDEAWGASQRRKLVVRWSGEIPSPIPPGALRSHYSFFCFFEMLPKACTTTPHTITHRDIHIYVTRLPLR